MDTTSTENFNLFGEIITPEEPEITPEAAENAELEIEEEPDDDGGQGSFSEYNNPIGLTSQFRFCGNPLRANTYRGCTFGCRYCFANARGGPNEGMFQNGAGPANLKSAVNMLKKAYTDEPTKNSNVEALRRGVPLHLGGMSDPFQAREFKEWNTVKFLQLTEKYKHPILISSKTDHLDNRHWELLNPERHAFQVSLIGTDADWLRTWETGTASPADRIAFMVELKGRGFWVGLRIQPLINIEEALSLVEATRGIVDYITVEHLKLPMDNKAQRNTCLELLGGDQKGLYISITRSAEMRTSLKIQNLERIQEAADVPVGAGDNDIHELSQSRCCCGLDTIGPAFDRWLKYNSTYFMTQPEGEPPVDRSRVWAPKSKVGGCFIGGKRDPNYHLDYRGRVDQYEEALKAGKYRDKNAQITLEEFLALEEGA